MEITRIDHFVLTVQDIQATCDFYAQALGMQVVTFGENRKALQFGQQKINLHQAGQEIAPKANKPTPGAADLCLIAKTPLPQAIEHLRQLGVEIEAGIVQRTGAIGTIQSIYIRDPDRNLIELSNYEPMDRES